MSIFQIRLSQKLTLNLCRWWEGYENVCFSKSNKYITQDINAEKLSNYPTIIWRT